MILEDGKLTVDAAPLLAVREALLNRDYEEAYHQLRLAADPDGRTFTIFGNHWHDWEFARAKAGGATAMKPSSDVEGITVNMPPPTDLS